MVSCSPNEGVIRESEVMDELRSAYRELVPPFVHAPLDHPHRFQSAYHAVVPDKHARRQSCHVQTRAMNDDR
jgi:hypothetical protein